MSQQIAGALRRLTDHGSSTAIKSAAHKLGAVSISCFTLLGIVLVPVSLNAGAARFASRIIADVGITSSRTSLSAFSGDLPSGLPAGGTVGVEGDFVALSALRTAGNAVPTVRQADPVALELIGYGPVQIAANSLEANGGSAIAFGDLADEASLSSSRTINPVIRALFATRSASGGQTPNNGAPQATTSSSTIPSKGARSTTAYIATSKTQALTLFMVCPANLDAIAGGGSSDAPGARLVASAATNSQGVALTGSGVARGWTISFSALGHVSLWVICSP